MLMLPIVIILVCVVVLFGTIGSAFTNVASGGQIAYDEPQIQQYADNEYAKAFSGTSAYEDNLLIVLLSNEAADGYYCIAWIGDNIDGKIINMFGDETTAFGRAVQGNVNSEYYAYSLDSNLASVMETMTDKVTALGLESSFRKQMDHSKTVESHVVNYTELSITEETVNYALEEFTEKTGISAVIVIDTTENVFGRTLSFADIFTVILVLIGIGFAIYLIVKAVRKNKNGGNGGNNNNNGNNYNNNYNTNYNNGRYNRSW